MYFADGQTTAQTSVVPVSDVHWGGWTPDPARIRICWLRSERSADRKGTFGIPVCAAFFGILQETHLIALVH